MNTFGKNFRVTTFGESHGKALGCVIDGCPPGIALAESDIQPLLDRRRPGKSALTSPRDESDKIGILSGVFEGKTTNEERERTWSGLCFYGSSGNREYAQEIIVIANGRILLE